MPLKTVEIIPDTILKKIYPFLANIKSTEIKSLLTDRHKYYYQ